jgi:hypothetical protein
VFVVSGRTLTISSKKERDFLNLLVNCFHAHCSARHPAKFDAPFLWSTLWLGGRCIDGRCAIEAAFSQKVDASAYRCQVWECVHWSGSVQIHLLRSRAQPRLREGFNPTLPPYTPQLHANSAMINPPLTSSDRANLLLALRHVLPANHPSYAYSPPFHAVRQHDQGEWLLPSSPQTRRFSMLR